MSALALLSGCGWFDDSPRPTVQKARPGLDRIVPATGALPSANPGRQYEPSVVAIDETRAPQIGSIVAAKGGQKAQKEAADKEASERDAKEREARDKRDAEEREEMAKEAKDKDKDQPAPVRTTNTGLPGKPAAAEPGNPDAGTTAGGGSSQARPAAWRPSCNRGRSQRARSESAPANASQRPEASKPRSLTNPVQDGNVNHGSNVRASRSTTRISIPLVASSRASGLSPSDKILPS